MTDFNRNMERARSAFDTCIQKPLLRLLAAEEILSIESDTPSSTISALLDKAGTSDLLISYRKEGLLQSAASRISFVSSSWKKNDPPPHSMSLGNGVNGRAADSELNKLWRMVCAFKSGVPVILPRYVCMSQVEERAKQPRLLELVAVETVPLVLTIFDRAAVNLPDLRRRFSAALATDVQKTPGSSVKATCVQLAEMGRDYAGLRANKAGGSFFFFTKEFLDDYALPYRRFVD